MDQLQLDGFEGGQVITAIELVSSDPLLRRIKAGRKTIATLPINDVVDIGIAEGEVLTVELASALAQASMKLHIRKASQKLIKRRAYSRGELIVKLQTSCSDLPLIEMVVDDLCNKGAINDEAYGQSIAMSLTQRGPISRSQLIHKLKIRHISPDLAQQIANEALEENDPVEAAITFARKRLRTMQSKPQMVITRRLWSALARRGFDSQTIRIVMNKVGLDIAEDMDG